MSPRALGVCLASLWLSTFTVLYGVFYALVVVDFTQHSSSILVALGGGLSLWVPSFSQTLCIWDTFTCYDFIDTHVLVGTGNTRELPSTLCFGSGVHSLFCSATCKATTATETTTAHTSYRLTSTDSFKCRAYGLT